MAFKNLQEFVKLLEDAGELVRIKEYVNPELEITEIADRVSKQYGPALLFENTGYDFPVLINSMGTEKRMAMALGVEKLDDLGEQIESLFKTLTGPKHSMFDKLKMLPQLGEIASWMPKSISGRGACQEVVMQNPDVTKLPVLKCWPEDGGPFITLPVIQTRDPHTGIRNVGLYRMQVFNEKMTGMHWHRHKVSARHFNEYKKLGLRMPVAVSIGGDPAYTYSATAPLPDGVDEFMLAGFIRKKRVELVKCLTIDLEVPADADFVIEGYVDPTEDFILEGPFGDHTGYYSLADFYPRFHVTAITHRKNPLYLTTIVGIPPQEDAWIGKATERIFLAPIKMTAVQEIVDMVLPVEGVFHNLVIVKIKKDYPGQALKVMNAMWGAGQMMFTKMMIVVDGDVNIHDNAAVAKHISSHVNVARDIFFSQGPSDVLDHSCSRMAFGGKMGIDATAKLEEEIDPSALADKVNVDALLSSLPAITSAVKQHDELKDLNLSLLSLGIPVVFVSIHKNRKGHVNEMATTLLNDPAFSLVKVLIFLEDNMDISDVADAVWRFANNVDPRRDHTMVKASRANEVDHVVFDGTRKTKAFDGFDRDWPNILASDEKTVKRIDEIWGKLGLGDFIPSPSVKYSKQLYAGGAVAVDQ
ncbi:MAG TPA: menaquinone biosynthesis decarboxylase [Bacteroidia bacterium]|nr:menaquinone biosynthesis decarboxylase [Bacteroidia bacterium]